MANRRSCGAGRQAPTRKTCCRSPASSFCCLQVLPVAARSHSRSNRAPWDHRDGRSTSRCQRWTNRARQGIGRPLRPGSRRPFSARPWTARVEPVGADVPAHQSTVSGSSRLRVRQDARALMCAGAARERGRPRWRPRRPRRRRTGTPRSERGSRCHRAAVSASTARPTAAPPRARGSRADSHGRAPSRRHRPRHPRPNNGRRLTSGRSPMCGDQPRVDGRHRHTSAGDQHDGVDLVGCDAGRVERRQYGPLPELDGDLDVGSVGFGEASQFRVPRQR